MNYLIVFPEGDMMLMHDDFSEDVVHFTYYVADEPMSEFTKDYGTLLRWMGYHHNIAESRLYVWEGDAYVD